jgi:hypothetical protein
MCAEEHAASLVSCLGVPWLELVLLAWFSSAGFDIIHQFGHYFH